MKHSAVKSERSPTPHRRRRLGIAGLVSAAVAACAWLFAGGAATTAVAQGDACDNGAIRSQQSATHLPDCRAYEQVSPVDKGFNNAGYLATGNGDRLMNAIISNAAGTKIVFGSNGAFAEPDARTFNNVYLSSRETGWDTASLTPPVAPPTLLGVSTVEGATADFSKLLITSPSVLTPSGAAVNDDNLYVHDRGSDSYEAVATFDGNPGLSGVAAFGGASEDGNRWFFTSTRNYASTPPRASNSENLYEYSDGELKLIGLLPDGSASPNGSRLGPLVGLPGSSIFGTRAYIARHAVSDDGGHVYWQPNQSDRPVYLYEGGPSKLVTERETDGTEQNGMFFFAVPDGSQAFLTSAGQLTADANGSGSDLYRYDRDANGGDGDLVNLTPDSSTPGATEAGVEGVLDISENGDYVYFQATGELAPGATAGERNLYVWHDDEIRLIATPASGYPQLQIVDDSSKWRASRNGQYFGFIIDGALAGPQPQADPDTEQAYLYDFESDSLTCASCPPPGAASAGPARLRIGLASGNSFSTSNEGLTRNVQDDGKFFFNSPDALVGSDTNNAEDVYQYQDGEVSLISTGQSAGGSFFGDASADGGDVFFVTRQGLVTQDKDTLYDVYAARVNGGLESQMPVSKPACQGDGCQGEPTKAPPADDPPSSVIDGSGNPEPSPSCEALAKKAGRKAARADRAEAKARKAKKKARKASGKKAKRLKKTARKLANRAYKAQKQATKAERKLSNCRSSK